MRATAASEAFAPAHPPANATPRFTVLFDGRVIQDTMTGIGRYALCLLGGFAHARLPLHLRVLIPAGLEVGHPVHDLPQAAEAPTRITLHPVDIPSVSLRQQLLMRPVFRRIHHDLYHYPHFDLPWGAPRPAVITVHDLKYVRYPELLRSRLRSLYLRWMMGASTRRAAAIIADSESTRTDLTALLGVAPGRIRTIYLANGIPVTLSQEERLAPLVRLGLAPRYLLFVGERRPHKNLVNLLEAYARVRSQLKDVPPLVIAGRAYADYRAPEAAITALGLGAHVRFLDRVADADLAGLYAGARGLLLPSLYEGFGFPILEAMGIGVPVITSNVSSMPEVAGDAALLVDPRDPTEIATALARLLADERLARDLAARGRVNARRFSWENAARNTFALYEETLDAV
jgi:glycosyltransferase involved in cell wall biosynthesis